MIHSILVGIGGVVALMLGWLCVQLLWRRAFSDYVSDEDALAGRSDCGNCGCTATCVRKTIHHNQQNDSNQRG